MSFQYSTYNPAGQYNFASSSNLKRKRGSEKKRKTPETNTVYKRRHRRFRSKEFQQKKLNFGEEIAAMQHTRSKKYVKYQRYSLKKAVYPSIAQVEDRFQGLTNYDTNSGYKRCSQFREGAGAIQWLPINIMDLTSFQEGANAPVVMKNIGWGGRGASDNLVQLDVYGQSSTGAASTGTRSWTVTDTPTTAIAATPRVFLKWVKLSLNLYGARNRTTTFRLHIVRFPQFNQNFFLNTSTAEAKELVQYLERPLMYNNLQVGETECAKKMSVIKSYKWTVQPMTTESLNTTTGNIKEAHVFVRMNKCFNLAWPDEGTHEPHAIPVGENNDGIDYETRIGAHKTGPNYGSRVYAILTAFSPVDNNIAAGPEVALTPSEAYAKAGAGGSVPSAANEPTFDFLIRRGYFVEPN